MHLASDVQEQIRRYAVGFISADDLSDWLDVHAQRIHDTGDIELRQLTGFALSVLEDVFQDHRTEDEARVMLSRLMPQTVTIVDSMSAGYGSIAGTFGVSLDGLVMATIDGSLLATTQSCTGTPVPS